MFGGIWLLFTLIEMQYSLNEGGSDELGNFYADNGLENLDGLENSILSVYFAMTTLSTIGFGDYYPISNWERIVMIFYFIGGVAVFSIIME